MHSEKPAPDSVFFPNKDENKNVPDWKAVKEYLARAGKLSKKQVHKIVTEATKVLTKEPNMVKVPEPAVVVGDVHGQYFDLITLLDINKSPAETNFLFLGDYVDRGIYGIEILLLLLSIKLNYPSKFFLLRGNHETRAMT